MKQIFCKIIQIILIIFVIVIVIPLTGAIVAPFILATLGGESGGFLQLVVIVLLIGGVYFGYKQLEKYNKKNAKEK